MRSALTLNQEQQITKLTACQHKARPARKKKLKKDKTKREKRESLV
jgi:hypothetical protein